MKRNLLVATVSVAILAVALTTGLWRPAAAGGDTPQTPARGDDAKKDSPEMAAVRKTADEFVQAFNKGDAKAVAAFCTKECEYIGPDGEAFNGRDAIEKNYVEFFKKNPKAKIAVEIETVRLFGRNTALEEGVLKLALPDTKEPEVTRYSVLHVREDDGWRMASIREWDPDPSELVSLKDVEWLLGIWEAKGEKAELRISYARDESKAFLRGTYTLKRDGKVESTGTQMIGKDPNGGLRSWVFDSSGTFGESAWTRDEGRWVVEAAGTLPNGSEVTGVSFLIPLEKDSFTWQTVERTVAGSAVPNTPPVKVTRVKE